VQSAAAGSHPVEARRRDKVVRQPTTATQSTPTAGDEPLKILLMSFGCGFAPVRG
jgi:hypothetical protein